MKAQSKILFLSFFILIQSNISFAWFFSSSTPCDLSINERETIEIKELVVDYTNDNPGSSVDRGLSQSQLRTGFYMSSSDPIGIRDGLTECINRARNIERNHPNYIHGTMTDCSVELKQAKKTFTEIYTKTDSYNSGWSYETSSSRVEKVVYAIVAKAKYKILKNAPTPEQVIQEKLEKISLCIKSEEDSIKSSELINKKYELESMNFSKKNPEQKSEIDPKSLYSEYSL